MLRKIVLQAVQINYLGLTSSENSLVKEISETIILNEVETDTKMFNVRFRVFNYTVSEGDNTFLS